MLTENTLLSKDSSPETMILSAVPEGLQRLAECGERLPHIFLTVDELDAIIEGKDTEDLERSCADGIYLQPTLRAISWWVEVAGDIACGNGMEAEFDVPELKPQKRNVIALLNDVLASYAAAFAETPYYSDDLGSSRVPAGMEFLKRYRLFTRYVCAFAQDVWPSVDLGWLLKQA